MKTIDMKEVIIPVPDGHELVQDGNTYTIKEKSKYPTSWKGLGWIEGYWVDGDSVINCDRGTSTYSQSNRDVYATKKQAEASISQAQITQLLKAYNGDWKADWTDDTNKFVILLVKDGWVRNSAKYNHNFLAFKTKEARDHFFEHHMDLFNKYKPLAG